MIKLLKKIFWFPFSAKMKIEHYQTEIRNLEWDSFKQFIPAHSTFLDVGCGAGYNMLKAKTELYCEVKGIDPSPGSHGVGRFSGSLDETLPILQGCAENIPFENQSFDLVFCSHVLEHVQDEEVCLEEIKRVMKADSVLIIGMPTATMSLIAIISHYLFTTHVNLLFLMKHLGTNEFKKRLFHLLIPTSHSTPNHRFITYDLKKYQITSWKKVVSKHFDIKEEITPYLYPYPDYIQWFPKMKLGRFSSSVFFICKKR